MVKYVDPFVHKSRADLQMFRYADFKYIQYITRPVKEWFMQCSNVMYEPMLVERIVQIALNADVYYRRKTSKAESVVQLSNTLAASTEVESSHFLNGLSRERIVDTKICVRVCRN